MLALLSLAGVLAKKKPRPSPTLDPVSGPSFSFGAPLSLFLVGLVVVGVIAYLSYRAKQQRITEIRALAARLGLTYTSDDVYGLLALPFGLLRQGDGRGIENVMHGVVENATMHVFDYWYYEESTDANGHRSRSTYRFNCVVASFDASGPGLSIAEENFLTRIADAVALDDIQFESEEFNRAFNVKGADERFATALVDARMMQWLLQSGMEHAFEVAGDRVFVSHRRVDVAGIPALMSTAASFVAQIPRVVSSLYPKSG
ncbi:MAG: hypothetical protein WD096_11820 [Actinomycetota bacterium]